MYLGQEQWAQAQQQQQHQQRAAGGCAPAAQAAGGSTPEVGNATQITLAGCRDTVVGPVIRGEYTMSSLNHGKPVYRRDAHVNGLQVMIYFWDDRDGEASAGWWIGPKVGSEQVWAHNAATDTKTPPVAGWKVPHTGPVDVTMQLAAKGGSAQAPNGMAFQQPGQQAQQQQQPQHQQPMQQQQHQQMQQQQQQHQQPMQQQHQQMQQQHQQPMQQQQHHQQQQQYSPAQQQQMSYQQHGQQGQQQYQPMQQQQQQHHQQQHGQQGQQQYQPMQQQQQQHHQQQQGMRQGSAQSGWQQANQMQQQHQQQHPQAQHQQHQQQSQQMHQQHPQQHQQMRQQQQHSQQQQWQQQQQAQQQQQQLRQQQQQQRQQALQQQQQQAQMLAQQRMQEQKQKQQQLAEQLKKKQEQEKAAGAIRKVAVKLKTVTPEKFDEVKEELQQAMTSGLEACGDLKAKVEAECKEGLQIAEKRIQQLQEQKVANMVRKTIQKIRMAKPESYEETKKELDEVLAKDLESCGSMKQTVKDEADKAVAQAEVRMEQAKELKRKQEEQKAENERKRKEAEEKAAQLLKELQEMVDSATSDADAVEKEVESVLEGMPKLSVQDIESSCQQVTEMADAVREKQQNIMEFIKKNTVAMRVTGWQVAKKIPKDGEAAEAEAAPAEELPSLPKLNQQSGLIRAKLEKCVNSLKGSKANGLKAAAAREALQGARSLVEKFDKDSDGLITKIELRSYAKEIQKVALQDAQLVRIMESLSQDAKDTKNIKVKVDDHQKIKVLVGIQKEIARDTKRREEREQKEAKYAASKAKLQTKLDELSTSVGETEKATLEAETKVTGLTVKGKTMTSSDMLEGSTESTEVLAEVKQGAAATTSKIDELSIGADEEALKHWFEIEKAKLKRRTTQVDNRLTKASNALSKFSEDAKRKDAKEVDVLRKKALAMIRYHQVKKECNNDALFEEFDKNGDDKIDQAEFVSFFESCEKEPPKAPAPAEGSDEKMDGDEESAAKADDEGKKEEEAEKKPEEKKPEEKKPEETEKPTKKGRGKGRGKVWKAAKKADKKAEEEVEVDLATIVLTDADLKRVFTSLDDEGEGSLSKEAFFRIIRMLMRVVKETVLTPNMKIKMEGGNMPICRLSVGDVVEVLMGPVKEEEEGLLRMQVKCIKDDQIGWASVRGTQGTVYFEEGGGAYKVVKETLLTDTFDISGDKENIRKVKDTTRKVKPGEIVDVWEWGRKDEERGLTRMKVKARLDGQVGWVTSMGNTGIAYLEPV